MSIGGAAGDAGAIVTTAAGFAAASAAIARGFVKGMTLGCAVAGRAVVSGAADTERIGLTSDGMEPRG